MIWLRLMKHQSLNLLFLVLVLSSVTLTTSCDLFFSSARALELENQPQVVKDFVQQLNAHRVSEGLSPLVWDPQVTAAALGHSRDMSNRNFFAHNAPAPNASTPWDRLADQGVEYTAAAENIAKGQTTGNKVLQDWLSSSEHRKNIENGTYTHHGVGYVAEGKYWTHKFIRYK